MKQIFELIQREPVMVAQESTILETVALMKAEKIGAVLVTNNGDIAGIFTERDFLTKIDLQNPDNLKSQTVYTIMTKDLIKADHTEIYNDVIEKMIKNRIRHLPVFKEGAVIGIVSLRDLITEYNRDLLQQIHKREKTGKDLIKAHDKLRTTQGQLIESEKMRVVGALAAGVAHEVKNPLMAIMQGIEYISKVVPSENENVHSVSKDILRAVNSANNVVKGLLDFARYSEINLNEGDINTAIRDTTLLLRHNFEKANIKIVEEMDPHLPPVKIDKSKIEQVFLNFFMNAIQAMDQGGQVIIKTSSKKAALGDTGVGQRKSDLFKPDDTLIIVDVENSGLPIPDELLDKVFDPYITSKRSQGGSGLGLSIAKNIISLHNGIISIKNKPSQGVVVTIILKA
ncbi:MAG: CBS domain-containing protein [Candidatus Omnitrophica bacterium]|nr:CBS domain-containing protein [Candidatus Omnitrophota bacterium]